MVVDQVQEFLALSLDGQILTLGQDIPIRLGERLFGEGIDLTLFDLDRLSGGCLAGDESAQGATLLGAAGVQMIQVGVVGGTHAALVNPILLRTLVRVLIVEAALAHSRFWVRWPGVVVELALRSLGRVGSLSH